MLEFLQYMTQGTVDMHQLMATTMDAFDRHRVIDAEINTNQTICEWTFSSALFFAAVVMTTIGKFLK